MGPRLKNAAAKVAQAMLSKEECAGSMGHIAMIHMMNLLRSEDQYSNRQLQVDLNPMLLLHLPS